MSGFADTYIPGQTPAEIIEGQQAANNTTRKFFNSFFSLPATLVSPDSKLPGLARYIPGAGLVEGLAGMGGQLIDAGSTLANAGLDAIGAKTHLPYAPDVLRAAGEHFEDTRSGIQDVIAAHSPLTKPDPNDPIDRLTDIAGSTIGSAVPIVPSGIVGAVARGVSGVLPGPLKAAGNIATHALLPSTEGLDTNIPVVSALAGAQTTASALTDPAQAKPPTAPPTDSQGIGIGNILGIGTAEAKTPNIGIGSVLGTAPAAPAQGDGGPNIGIGSVLQGDTAPGPTNNTIGHSPMTVWQALATIGVGIVALAAGKYTHGTSRVINDVDRTARFNDPTYAAQAADYNNERIARGGTDISPPDGATPPPTPEQNPFRHATNAVNNALLDSHAQMVDAIKMSIDPSDAQKIAHQYGNLHNDMSWDARMTNFLETGRDPLSGVSIPRPAKLYADWAGLDTDRERVLNDGLHAADELDNRVDNAKLFRKANPGAVPTPEDIRHNFKYQDNMDLNNKVQLMNSDPVLADMADRYHRITNGLIDIGEGHGFFTRPEVGDLKATHPNYVPEVGPTGETQNPMQRRDKTLSMGTDQVNSKAIYNLAQHIEELYKQFHLNDVNRSLRQSQMDTQRQFPGSAQFMYDVPAPPKNSPTFYTGGSFREPVVTIRHPTGPTFTRVDHPDFYNAMTGDSLRKREIGTGILTIPRRMITYLTTGPGSLVTGRFAPLVNVGYTAATLGTNAPKGYYGGFIDRAVQRNLPGRVANVLSPIARGIDTVSTTPVGIAGSYARGVGDRWVDRASKIIAPGENNYINNTLRAYYGDAYINTWQNAMQRAYTNSITNQMRDRGMGGMGIPVKTDLPTLQIAANKQAKLVAAHLVPKLFMSDGAFGNAKPVMLNLNRVVQEGMSHISDAGHDYFARLNWDNPNVTPEGLTHETRSLTGDPGVHGASVGLQKVMSVIPYGNIGIQGTARLGRSLGERPIGAPMTIATGFGILALAEIFTHMRSQGHLNYYQDDLSSQQRAANIVLATSNDPTKPTMIPVAQEFRPFKALMSELVAKATNVIAMQHDPDWFKNVWQGVGDFLGAHFSNSSIEAMEHGVADMLPNLPNYAGSIDWTGVIHGKDIVDAYRAPVSGHPLNMPGQAQDGPLDDKEGKAWSSILKSVFGLAGMAFDGFNNVARYAKQTGSWATAIGMGGHDWLQGAQDRNPQLNMLWDHQVRLSVQPPIVEVMTRKLDALSKITEARTADRFQGLSGTNRFAQPVPLSTTPKLPVDPVMRNMYNIASAYHTRMAPQLTQIKELKTQMAAVNAQGMDPATRRTWMNQQTRSVADKYRFVGDMIADMEHALSAQVGRPVHIDDVDWTKGPEQFQ